MDSLSKISERKNSVGCLNLMSPKSCSPINYSKVENKMHLAKSKSLPTHSSMKNLDKMLLNVQSISPDVLASQLTLLDLEVFQLIQPDELTSCAWTKKDKDINTPNIVAFTKRFNYTSFWVVQEILSLNIPKHRVELLSHFIKMAKKLHNLNNLHSLFAVISALQSASIYRLERTWNLLSKKDKQTFDKLREIFSDENNWRHLRNYLDSLRLPCIPYLGLFLTDLIYIDMAYPHTDSYFEPSQRRNKMNNILRVISNYQQSNYNHLIPNESVQQYIKSIRYIDELQNIFEADQYKKSMSLEPNHLNVKNSEFSTTKELENIEKQTSSLAQFDNLHYKTNGSLRLEKKANLIHGHRKCSSLGSNIFWKLNSNENGLSLDSQYKQNFKQRNLLDDSDFESHCPNPNSNVEKNVEELKETSITSAVCLPDTRNITMQGYVRRKTIQKEWRKAKLAQWQRYWMQLWENSLIYFLPKSFKGHDRNDFKREPHKICSLDGWCTRKLTKTNDTFTFEMYNKSLGTIYKFRTNNLTDGHRWTHYISSINEENIFSKSQSLNLMSFE